LSPPLTPSQTVGPYLELGLPWEAGPYADPDGVRIFGRVLDGDGEPVQDALIETWDAEHRLFARCPTDDDGAWFVVTRATSHLAVNVLARGLLHRLVTRICFDEAAIPDGVPPARRETLLPERTDDGHRFDIRLQGPGETVFFDV
jgi:protocatechuate 3,4-dioxygenase alpha subunit